MMHIKYLQGTGDGVEIDDHTAVVVEAVVCFSSYRRLLSNEGPLNFVES